MAELKKTEVMKNVLSTLINISGRKTTKGHALTTMEILIKKLKNEYDFLRHIQINDIRFSEEEDAVSIMSDIESVDSSKIGKAIETIITTMNRSLGKDAGHFFIKEIQKDLGDEYTTSMKEMGVDLNLLQLEHEIEEWEKIATHKD